MAEPARRERAANDAPSFDPLAVERAYRLHRARRRVRLERKRERGLARLRFWVVLLALLTLVVVLALTVWHEIERLFGL